MRTKKHDPKDRLLAVLELQDVGAVELSEQEVHALQVQWRRVFSSRVKKLTGKNVYLGFDWHAFSYSMVHSLKGEDARQAYRQESCRAFYVLPHMDEGPGYKCQAKTLPVIDGEHIDAYICPLSFGWTMVYTHESECGPYFTRSEWAERQTTPALR